jgi:6-phosphofructokinase 1
VPALLVGQSGGPTAVINASLAGVVRAALGSGVFERVLGMRNGVQGLLEGRVADLSGLSDELLVQLAHSPSAALGSCRYRLQTGDTQRLVEFCRAEDVQALVYIGGNDSADTSASIGAAAREAGLDLRVMGVPKTIDNDLPVTDHCPGYGSAARFVAQTTRETALDTWAMRATDPIRLVEVMGRYAGWLPGAGWLARGEPDDAPHLVYVPERPVAAEQIVEDVERVYHGLGWCVVVLCENQPLGEQGEPRWVDAFGHAYYDSPAQSLAQRITQALGVRARFDKPGTIQRMATAYASGVDRAEAELVGQAAVRELLEGASGVMVTLEREPGAAYAVTTGTVDLQVVANQQKRLPEAFINAAGNGLTEAFETYARPLLGEPLPTFVRF